jgi:RNA methyltransferase, TrmH family
MLSKNRMKFIKSLHSGKGRWAERMFLAEGTKLVRELLQNRYGVTELIALESWLEGEKIPDGVTVTPVNAAGLAQVSALTTPQEVVALVRMPDHSLPALQKDILLLALDGVKDPGNLGTIVRIADWFGIRDIVCSEDTVDVYNPKVVQATMGSIARTRVHYTSLSSFLEAADSHYPVYGAVLNGAPVSTVQSRMGGTLLMGNESHGISPDLLSLVTHPVTIPSFQSAAESLNVAVATALVCYEFRR